MNHLICKVLLILIFVFTTPELNAFSLKLELISYNVENLFDLDDDSLTMDDEFTPLGIRYWDRQKFNQKILNLSRGILGANFWKYPSLIALGEVENENVVEKLLSSNLLENASYKILHSNSQDRRGIDLAILYDSIKLKCVYFKPIELKSLSRKSRDIYYAKFAFKQHILHLLVNHWPSRYSGTLSSESSRIYAAQVLRDLCDSILYSDPKALIIISGDFNDNPWDTSLKQLCSLKDHNNQVLLYNLMSKSSCGTHKYQGVWNCFDQFIVSKELMDTYLIHQDNYIVDDLDFLLINDQKYLGKRPFRSYYGYKYEGGYSDHLPILLKLKF